MEDVVLHAPESALPVHQIADRLRPPRTGGETKPLNSEPLMLGSREHCVSVTPESAVCPRSLQRSDVDHNLRLASAAMG
jgi:hypothetical protein